MNEGRIEQEPSSSPSPANFDLGIVGTDVTSYVLEAAFPEYKTLIEMGIKDPAILRLLDQFEDKEAAIDGCRSMFEAFVQQGIDSDAVTAEIERYGEGPYFALYQAIEGEIGPVNIARNILTGAEILEASIDRDTYPFPVFRRPRLDGLPRLQQRINSLGLGDDLAYSMFDSWSTYDEATRALINGYARPLKNNFGGDGALEEIAKNQAQAYTRNIDKMEEFAASYGKDKLIGVIETFGIYNFARHEPAKLAEQVRAWQDGEPIKSVIVDPRSDWNSFDKSNCNFEGGFADGVFHFEANSGVDIARIAVNVGNHERSNGREPAIRFFIVHAHGSPGGMELGTTGEGIRTGDYADIKPGNKANDYKKHLGQGFELVLLSCSTAGPVAGGMNIAETMSKHHDVTVHACNTVTTGLSISSEGSIDFQTKDNEGELVSYVTT